MKQSSGLRRILGLRLLSEFRLLVLATKINGILLRKAEMTKDLKVYEKIFEKFFENEESIIEILGNIGG